MIAQKCIRGIVLAIMYYPKHACQKYTHVLHIFYAYMHNTCMLEIYMRRSELYACQDSFIQPNNCRVQSNSKNSDLT